MPYHIFESTSTGKLDFMKKSLALGPKKQYLRITNTVFLMPLIKQSPYIEYNSNKTDQLCKIHY